MEIALFSSAAGLAERKFMDQIKALEVFVAVARAGSFSAAARATGMSAPSITRIVQELEDTLGVVLFQRTTRQVSPTAAGSGFLDDAQRLLSDYTEACEAVRGTYGSPKGHLRVTAPTLFGRLHVTPVLRHYMDQYPDVTVDAIFTERRANLIEEGIDAAVRLGNLPDSELRAVRVGAVRWVVCAAPAYIEKFGVPNHPADLADHRIAFVGPTPGPVEWQFAGGVKVKLSPRFAVSSVASTIETAVSGWGLTRALSYQVSDHLAEGSLVAVMPEFEPAPLPVHVVHAQGRRVPAKVRTFIDLAAEKLRARLTI